MDIRDAATSELVKLAIAAEAKLRYLGNVFSAPNFTDRHNDGPECLAIANAIKKVLK